jgi:hypothetical protein
VDLKVIDGVCRNFVEFLIRAYFQQAGKNIMEVLSSDGEVNCKSGGR